MSSLYSNNPNGQRPLRTFAPQHLRERQNFEPAQLILQETELASIEQGLHSTLPTETQKYAASAMLGAEYLARNILAIFLECEGKNDEDLPANHQVFNAEAGEEGDIVVSFSSTLCKKIAESAATTAKILHTTQMSWQTEITRVLPWQQVSPPNYPVTQPEDFKLDEELAYSLQRSIAEVFHKLAQAIQVSEDAETEVSANQIIIPLKHLRAMLLLGENREQKLYKKQLISRNKQQVLVRCEDSQIRKLTNAENIYFLSGKYPSDDEINDALRPHIELHDTFEEILQRIRERMVEKRTS